MEVVPSEKAGSERIAARDYSVGGSLTLLAWRDGLVVVVAAATANLSPVARADKRQASDRENRTCKQAKDGRLSRSRSCPTGPAGAASSGRNLNRCCAEGCSGRLRHAKRRRAQGER
jgi:hypothetical protein